MAFNQILGDVGAFANPYGVPSQGLWNLARGTFTNADNESIVFFFEQRVGDESPAAQTAMDQTVDSGGRRLAVYKYAYRDGQQVADLGREGFTFTFNIKFFGPNYQEQFRRFTEVVINSRGQGTLLHPTLSPVFGSFSCRFHTFEFVHRHDEFNAITIKAVFIEDNIGDFGNIEDITGSVKASTDSVLRQALQDLVSIQANISAAISAASALLLLPAAVQNAMKTRLNSIIGQASRLMGQLGATFSSDVQLHTLSQQSANVSGGVTGLTSGTAQVSNNGGQSVSQQLPPVFQVGYDPATMTAVESDVSAFVNANQVTPQQAVFQANQARAAITAAIAQAEENLDIYSYDTVLEYRNLAVTIQTSVEASLSTSQSRVKLFTVSVPMSLRQIAFANGLDPDRQNDIEALNPYLGSVNLVPAGSVIAVPAS